MIDLCTQIMTAKLAAKPELVERLLPDFTVGCRRPTPGNGFLEALCSPKVDCVFDAIVEFTPKGIRTADGTEHEFDAIICATGFNADCACARSDVADSLSQAALPAHRPRRRRPPAPVGRHLRVVHGHRRRRVPQFAPRVRLLEMVAALTLQHGPVVADVARLDPAAARAQLALLAAHGLEDAARAGDPLVRAQGAFRLLSSDADSTRPS